MKRFDTGLNNGFQLDKKLLDEIRGFTDQMTRLYYWLSEKVWLAMVNRKPPEEFDDEEILGALLQVDPGSHWYNQPNDKVSISMDENGYTIAKPQPSSSINASFVWVTFAQLDEVEKVLPDHGYVKVDGKWLRA